MDTRAFLQDNGFALPHAADLLVKQSAVQGSQHGFAWFSSVHRTTDARSLLLGLCHQQTLVCSSSTVLLHCRRVVLVESGHVVLGGLLL